MFARYLTLEGRRVLDIGCGNGGLTRWLAIMGAEAIGVEPDAASLAEARGKGHGRWLGARAECLPLPAACVDLTIFFNSLHHVAPARQVAALAEACRVLRRGGDLLVVEPVASGSLFALLRQLDDESAVRAAAMRAVSAVAGRLFAPHEIAFYTTTVSFTDPDAAVAGFIRAAPEREPEVARAMPAIERLFIALGEADGEGGRRFQQPMTVRHLRRLA